MTAENRHLRHRGVEDRAMNIDQLQPDSIARLESFSLSEARNEANTA